MLKKIIFAAALILAACITANTCAADTQINANVNNPPLDLYTLIGQAKLQLDPIKLNYSLSPQYKISKPAVRSKTPAKKVLSHYNLDIKDIALAVLDPKNNTIHTIMAMQRGSEFEFPPQYRDFDIRTVRFNGVNTHFEVSKPFGGKVLALKYLITPVESGSRAEIDEALYNGLYVPYSPVLLDAELSKIGGDYLADVITQAAQSLGEKLSVSEPGKTIPKAISSELVRALLYAEHMDTKEFLATSNTGSLVDKVNILLAGNKGDTWKYSVSTAGAAGISQFIPGTYASLVKRHPDARLIKDFVTGMRDHINAVKATYILLDDYIADVKARAPEHFLPGHSFDYGVAAYNGGPVRVSRAAKMYGATWYEGNFHQIAELQQQIAAGEASLESIRARFFASKDKQLKATLQSQADAQRASLKELNARKSALGAATLREETVHYLEKIHRLIQHFNSQPSKVVARK